MKKSILLSLLLLGVIPTNLWGQASAEELVKKAGAALKDGKTKEALELTTQAIKADPAHVPAYFLRGSIHQLQHEHEQAIADFTKSVELAPKLADAYQLRGLEHFRLGHIQESIRDFDRYLELKPKRKPEHWQRGISYYYAGKFKEGKEQFEGYQDFDSNDVENAVWRYLCMVPLVGKTKARAAILKIGKDDRVPMRQVYDLFSGKIKPEDVLAAAKGGKSTPQELNQRLFYAHLYLGLYYESEGDAKKTLEQLSLATDHRIGHYMWDVARVHRDILKKKNKKGP
jgi:lipoprotein NlpI